MTFKEVFKNGKPVIGMIHTGCSEEFSMLELARKYGAKFIQIDSVCGHPDADDEKAYVKQLQKNRKEYGVAVLGGVRFKYQPVRSGRSTEEDLILGKERCDAVVCTGTGTGIETPMAKVEQFKATLGVFPVVVGAGVTLDTARETLSKSDGMIVGSWFKYGHEAHNEVNEEFVKTFMEALA